MTQREITPNDEILTAFYQQLQTHPLYINLMPILESASPPGSNVKPQKISPRTIMGGRS